MKKIFKNMKKLLCYLIISLFIMGIGGERVGALVINRDTSIGNGGAMDFRNGVDKGGNRYFKFVTGSGQDAYCLNSKLSAPNGQDLPSFNDAIDEHTKSVIGTIILASDKYKNLISNDAERYYVTQALIWKYIGDGPYSGGQGSPNTYNFQNWIESKYSNFVNKITDELGNLNNNVDINDEQIRNYYLNISGNESSNVLTLNENNNRLESEDLTITSNIQNSFQVNVSGGSILYNGQTYTGSATIQKGEPFKVIADVPTESGTVDVTVDVSANYSYNIPTVNIYGYLNSSNIQSVAVLTSQNQSGSANDSRSFTATVTIPETPETPETPVTPEIPETPKKNVEFEKIDASTNQKLAGVKFELRDSNDNRLATFTSTGANEANPTYEFTQEGTYKLVETSGVKTYYFDEDSTKRTTTFKVVKVENELVLKDQNDVTISTPKIVVKNYKTKLRFKKVDETGNPVAGIKFIIQADVNAHTLPESRVNETRFFGISGSDGYIRKCDSNFQNCESESSSAIYDLGTDLIVDDLGGEMYVVYELDDELNKFDTEEFNLGYSGTAYSRFTDKDPDSSWGFGLNSNKNGVRHLIFNKYISLDKAVSTLTIGGEQANVSVYDFTFTNTKTLKVGKTDITTGAEIAGAKLVITDPSIEGNDNNGNALNIVDSWTSEAGKTHKVIGLKTNHRYRLEETIAPEGYYKMATAIDFEMDDNGNVTTYEAGTENVISDLTGTDYELLITNDKVKTYISKTSAVTGEEVAGAHLKVCTDAEYSVNGNDCETNWEWTSGEELDSNGKIIPHKIEGLTPGTYWIVETIAPTGYIRQTNAVSFELKEGEVEKPVEFKNEPTKIKIQKLDLVTKKRIAGATLQILNAEDRSIAKDASGNELTWVSTEDSDWEIYAIPAGKYILVEKVVPEGYQEGMIIDGITTSEYEFEISDQEGDINIEFGKEVLNAPNTGISTLNLFAIGGLLVFAGYETIKIYRRKTING